MNFLCCGGGIPISSSAPAHVFFFVIRNVNVHRRTFRKNIDVEISTVFVNMGDTVGVSGFRGYQVSDEQV